MHPRPARTQAVQDIGRDGRQIDRYVAFALRRSHLSLRRHDPDQVLWVGFRLSARPRARHPMRLLAQLVARGPMPFKGLKSPPAGLSGNQARLTLRTRVDYFSPDRIFTTRAFCSGVTSPTTATTFLWVA